VIRSGPFSPNIAFQLELTLERVVDGGIGTRQLLALTQQDSTAHRGAGLGTEVRVEPADFQLHRIVAVGLALFRRVRKCKVQRVLTTLGLGSVYRNRGQQKKSRDQIAK
jgi:hypothetical protein